MMHRAGLRAISFGVEAMSPAILKKVGRRPIPEAHQQTHRRSLPQARHRDGRVLRARIPRGRLGFDAARRSNTPSSSGSTVAQFKILTPYPGTPLWKKMAPLVTETDWERFDGFTPNFTHPNLTHDAAPVPAGRRVHALLHAAVVPGELPADYRASRSAGWSRGSTRSVSRLHARRESEECPGPSHAEVGHPALRRARAAEHRATHQRRRKAGQFIEGPHVREFEIDVCEAARRRPRGLRRRTAAWPSTTS